MGTKKFKTGALATRCLVGLGSNGERSLRVPVSSKVYIEETQDCDPQLSSNPEVTKQTTEGHQCALNLLEELKEERVPNEMGDNIAFEGESSVQQPDLLGTEISGPTTTLQDVPYFRNILQSETERLTSFCLEWDKSIEMDIPEEAKDLVRTTIGKTRLLMAERFKQFEGLINHCEFKSGEKETACTDLLGYWEMVNFQVENITKKFENLKKLEANGWQMVDDVQPHKPAKVASSYTSKGCNRQVAQQEQKQIYIDKPSKKENKEVQSAIPKITHGRMTRAKVAAMSRIPQPSKPTIISGNLPQKRIKIKEKPQKEIGKEKITVENITKKFENLKKLEANGWQMVDDVQPHKPAKVASSYTSKGCNRQVAQQEQKQIYIDKPSKKENKEVQSAIPKITHGRMTRAKVAAMSRIPQPSKPTIISGNLPQKRIKIKEKPQKEIGKEKITVENITKKFENLKKLEANGWQMVDDVQPHKPAKKKPILRRTAKAAGGSAESRAARKRLASVKAAMKNKAKEGLAAQVSGQGAERIFDGGFFRIESHAKPFPGSSCDDEVFEPQLNLDISIFFTPLRNNAEKRISVDSCRNLIEFSSFVEKKK
ncbi:uncharacterized protein [Erythrolamprus reginae]|uniref:uncharacterized protein isoform X2 n=1 Tax=Erythrolamprus reginae TaxID=121349 RepID=UPI00396CF030